MFDFKFSYHGLFDECTSIFTATHQSKRHASKHWASRRSEWYGGRPLLRKIRMLLLLQRDGLTVLAFSSIRLDTSYYWLISPSMHVLCHQRPWPTLFSDGRWNGTTVRFRCCDHWESYPLIWSSCWLDYVCGCDDALNNTSGGKFDCFVLFHSLATIPLLRWTFCSLLLWKDWRSCSIQFGVCLLAERLTRTSVYLYQGRGEYSMKRWHVIPSDHTKLEVENGRYAEYIV